MAMTKRHVEGAARIVELKGGPQTLGMDGFLAILFAKYSEDVGLTAGPAYPLRRQGGFVSEST